MAVPLAAALGRAAVGGAQLASGSGIGRAIGVQNLAVGLGQLSKSATGALGAVTGLASSLTGGLLGPLEAVTGMVDTIGKLVGLFNPGIVTQFQLALNDTMAVLGAMLIPVLQGATDYVRTFGDGLAKLMPVLQPLFDTIGQFITNYAVGLIPIIEASAPFIQLFADTLAELLKILSRGVAFLQGVVAELIDTLAALFGLDSSRFKADATSRGFAARQTKVTGVEQFARDVFASTAKNIYARQGGGKKPEQLLEEIKGAMEAGRELVRTISTNVGLILAILQAGAKPVVNIAGPVGDIARNPFDLRAIATLIQRIAMKPLG